MTRFEFTTDADLITKLVTIPECYRRSMSDGSPAIEMFRVTGSEPVGFVVGYENGTPVAIYLLIPAPDGAAEVHCAVVPSAWGRGEGITKDFCEWVWKHTGLTYLIGKVPSYNRLCVRLARRIGFAFKGSISGGTRRGKPFDFLISKLDRPALHLKVV